MTLPTFDATSVTGNDGRYEREVHFKVSPATAPSAPVSG